MEKIVLNKEMIDLAMKIKRHLRSNHDISVALGDPLFLEKMLCLKELKDPLLQGMLQYLMALAGSEWSTRYESHHVKRGLFRGNPIFEQLESDKAPESVVQQNGAGGAKKPVRYYRGQPVYK